MAGVVAGNVVTQIGKGRTYEDVVVHHLWRPALAASLLGAGLLTLDAVGLGTFAAAFGGLVVLGYLLAGSGALGREIEHFVLSLQSTSGV